MIIENMTAAHVSQIAELEKLCFSDPWSEKSIETELSCRLSVWLVALEGDKVVGYVGSQTVMDETDMMNIAVDPEHRRRRIAARLIDALISELRQKGSRCLTLEVRESNLPAAKLYESMGFAQIGLRKNYYRNPRENALILRKEWEI
jgi:ribosomal-protein-alanine N-acetyltransferase